MVKVKEDLTGKIFERLTVLKQTEDYIEPKSGQHRDRWICICSCEGHKQVVVLGKALKQGRVKSCGCLKKENADLIRKALKTERYNNYNLNGDYGIGYCTNTGNEFYFDLEDYELKADSTALNWMINDSLYNAYTEYNNSYEASFLLAGI